MIPTNEQEVVYLFCRNHEKLGFEKILRLRTVDTPDCIALKDGKEVGIEFEFQSKNFLSHYILKKFSSRKLYDYRVWGGKIQVFHKENPDNIVDEFDDQLFEVWNPLMDKTFGNVKGDPFIIKFKSLSKSIPYVVCWEKDCELNDKIQIIELRNLNLS